MQPTEIAYFTISLFLALVALIQWKRRRDMISVRLNRGLRGYVATRTAATSHPPHRTQGEDLIPV